MAYSYAIFGVFFPSKDRLKDFVRKIISRYDCGSKVVGDDLNFLKELFFYHPEYEQKLGCGISTVIVDLDQKYRRNKCFYIIRSDDTVTDISWNACIDGKNLKREILDAFRCAIEFQIKTFRDGCLTERVFCPYTKEILHRGNCHVDHVAPKTFMKLVSLFLEGESVDLMSVSITDPKDQQFSTELTDAGFRNRWEVYHQRESNLRLISKTANLSYAKKNTM